MDSSVLALDGQSSVTELSSSSGSPLDEDEGETVVVLALSFLCTAVQPQLATVDLCYREDRQQMTIP